MGCFKPLFVETCYNSIRELIQVPDFKHYLLFKHACPITTAMDSCSLIHNGARKLGREITPARKNRMPLLGLITFHLEDLRSGANSKNCIMAYT